MTKTSLSDKFKQRETMLRTVLPKNKFYAIRLDGKAFHQFTKQYERPYDFRFMESMNKTAEFLIDQVFPSALLAYVQSDEISVFFTDKTGDKTELPFAGKIEKILTVSSSAATGGFMRYDPKIDGVPLFDARLTVLENLDEVLEYLTWRRLDAQKNSISMAAVSMFSPSELHGVSTSGRRKALSGTKHERLPEGFFNGRLIVRRESFERVEYVHKKTREELSTMAKYTSWETIPALRDVAELEVVALKKKIDK